jgi:hypothetical protein
MSVFRMNYVWVKSPVLESIQSGTRSIRKPMHNSATVIKNHTFGV